MSSLKHIEAATAQPPKRQRGRIRVAAIMNAAVELFAEKGYDAATMTEIAAHSGTAIGSLYRFFPNKEALADALLLRYAQHVLGGYAELAQQAPSMTLDALAGALVDFKLALHAERSIAIALADARGGSAPQRAQLRAAMRDGMAQLLRQAISGLPKAKSEAMAVVLLHLLKAVPGARQEKPALRSMQLAEIRELARLYLAAAKKSLMT